MLKSSSSSSSSLRSLNLFFVLIICLLKLEFVYSETANDDNELKMSERLNRAGLLEDRGDTELHDRRRRLWGSVGNFVNNAKKHVTKHVNKHVGNVKTKVENLAKKARKHAGNFVNNAKENVGNWAKEAHKTAGKLAKNGHVQKIVGKLANNAHVQKIVELGKNAHKNVVKEVNKAKKMVQNHFDEDCWYNCGQKQGPCEWCGAGGKCCRKGWKGNGCNGQEGAANKHTCVRADNIGKECWSHCGARSGKCSWCSDKLEKGKAGFCCRKGYGVIEKDQGGCKLTEGGAFNHKCIEKIII